jgi:hypothetical protein
MEINKVDTHKKELLQALKEAKGIVSFACDKVGLSRTTFYNYLNEDEVFKLLVEEINEEAIDFVESKLHEKINGIKVMGREGVYEQPPSDTAIIFYLKTKGKKRGYVERSEIDHTTKGESINPTPIKFSKPNE